MDVEKPSATVTKERPNHYKNYTDKMHYIFKAVRYGGALKNKMYRQRVQPAIQMSESNIKYDIVYDEKESMKYKENYWKVTIDKQEDLSNLAKDEKSKTPIWKKSALLFLLMPKGGVIFAPILLKKLFGPKILSLSGADLQIFAAKAVGSVLLLLAYKAVMKFRSKDLITQDLPS